MSLLIICDQFCTSIAFLVTGRGKNINVNTNNDCSLYLWLFIVPLIVLCTFDCSLYPWLFIVPISIILVPIYMLIQTMIVLLNNKVCIIKKKVWLFCWKQSLFWFLVNTNELKDKILFCRLFIKTKTNLLLNEKKNKYRILLACFHEILERRIQKLFYWTRNFIIIKQCLILVPMKKILNYLLFFVLQCTTKQSLCQ